MNHEFVVAFLGALCLSALIGYALLFRPISSGVEPQTSSIQNPIIAEMISKISKSEIYKTVYHLQNFTTRMYGYGGNTEAAVWIYDELSNITGLDVEYQGIYKNVIATLGGTDPSSTAIFIVGAHYDSFSSDPNNAPGCTDNGGGVAIVLELARVMSQYSLDHTIKFALWNKEETGDVVSKGSMDYVKWASSNNLNISLYLNYDSSCYDPSNRFVLDIMYNSKSQLVSDMMTESNTLYNIDFNLTYNKNTCTSDHSPFWSYGYTAIMTHAETHGTMYHTPSDTIEKISTSYARKNGQLGMSVLAELAEVQAPWIPPDIVPPHISILSPTNETYSTNSLPLTFTLNESASWIGYSLDGQENVTISGNITLTDLSEGAHMIVAYANDTMGNMGQSDTLHFTVDTIHPAITVLSPENKTYITSSVSLNFKVNRPTSWMGYSLDSQMDTTIGGNVTLVDLSEGSHTIRVYANDTAGNMGQSDVVYFTVDTTSPIAKAGNDQTANEDTAVAFDGSASTDENGIQSYTWTFTDLTPQTLNGKNPTYTFVTPGTYTVTLEVTDQAGNTATDTVTITVLDVTNPVANAGQDQTVNVGAAASFDAGGTTDNVGIVSYAWDFGDGTMGAGRTTIHTYTNPGTYAVTLTVKDSANNSASHSITVTVHASETFPMWIVGPAVVTIAAIILAAAAATILLRKRK